jgi:DNA-cytosine methyltransferase
MDDKLRRQTMNVLSLFDGMSCGRIALEKCGFQVNKYYACEIDKYAIKVAKANYPDTVQLGDVTSQAFMNWVNAMADKGGIDLLIGGSPCQGFSFAGKQLNFDDPRSKLFWVYVKVLKKLKPKYFLLENVKMKKQSMDVITEALGVEPIFINSRLVSAQNRQRYYWTNIPMDKLPDDKGIILADVLEDGHVDRDKSHCIDANYFKGGNLKSYFEKHRRQLVFSDDGMCHVGDADLKGHGYNRRVYHPEGKAPSLCAASGGNLEPKTFVSPNSWRKLTPLECERLQTVPEGYTNHVSNTQRYRMLGNGWTVDVVAHILKGMQQ